MNQSFSTFRAALAIACVLLVPIPASADGTDELMPDIGSDN